MGVSRKVGGMCGMPSCSALVTRDPALIPASVAISDELRTRQ